MSTRDGEIGDSNIKVVAVVPDITMVENLGQKCRAARIEALEICPT